MNEERRGMTFTKDDGTAGMPDTLKDVPIGPIHGIAAIALNMALKYHDITTVQDGTLYQQYKLEGRNFATLHLDMVFETAMQIEAHMIGANSRITKLLIGALDVMEMPDEAEGEAEGETTEPAP